METRIVPEDAGLIKTDESDTTSTHYAHYLPFWA